MLVETVRVQREKNSDNPTGIVVINKEDLTADDKLAEGEIVHEVPAATGDSSATPPPAIVAGDKPWLRKPE